MNITIPFEILQWLDEHKGNRSRAAYIVFILNCLKNGNLHLIK